MSAIEKLKEPGNIDELCHFLGLKGFYKIFFLLFTNVKKNLSKLLKKDTKFQWSLQCQATSEHLKQALCKEHILQYPNMENHTPCLLMTVTMHTLGVLTQTAESPEDLRPIVYTQVSFSEIQQRWSGTKKEGLYSLTISP